MSTIFRDREVTGDFGKTLLSYLMELVRWGENHKQDTHGLGFCELFSLM